LEPIESIHGSVGIVVVAVDVGVVVVPTAAAPTASVAVAEVVGDVFVTVFDSPTVAVSRSVCPAVPEFTPAAIISVAVAFGAKSPTVHVPVELEYVPIVDVESRNVNPVGKISETTTAGEVSGPCAATDKVYVTTAPSAGVGLSTTFVMETPASVDDAVEVTVVVVAVDVADAVEGTVAEHVEVLTAAAASVTWIVAAYVPGCVYVIVPELTVLPATLWSPPHKYV
jgi:hypothetical protein